MRLPKQIKIGSTMYMVKISGKITSWGEVDFPTQTISINKLYADSPIAIGVLFHEMLEVIKHSNALKCSHQTLGVFAEQMYTTLKDNNLLK